jgi:maleylacetoacetate isomerase
MAKLVLSNYWRSSCSYRVRLALGFKGLAYEPVYVNLIEGEQHKADYKAQNPIGHVPTLTIDGVPYVESVAIMELLEELYPEPAMLPKTPHARACVRAMVETINAGIQPLQNLIVLDLVGDVKTEQDKRVAWMKRFMPRGLAAFEALVARAEAAPGGASGPFAYGSTFTLADACLVPQVYAARRIGLDLAPFPRILRVEAACAEMPFVADARPEAQGDAKP